MIFYNCTKRSLQFPWLHEWSNPVVLCDMVPTAVQSYVSQFFLATFRGFITNKLICIVISYTWCFQSLPQFSSTGSVLGIWKKTPHNLTGSPAEVTYLTPLQQGKLSRSSLSRIISGALWRSSRGWGALLQDALPEEPRWAHKAIQCVGFNGNS